MRKFRPRCSAPADCTCRAACPEHRTRPPSRRASRHSTLCQPARASHCCSRKESSRIGAGCTRGRWARRLSGTHESRKNGWHGSPGASTVQVVTPSFPIPSPWHENVRSRCCGSRPDQALARHVRRARASAPNPPWEPFRAGQGYADGSPWHTHMVKSLLLMTANRYSSASPSVSTEFWNGKAGLYE